MAPLVWRTVARRGWGRQQYVRMSGRRAAPGPLVQRWGSRPVAVLTWPNNPIRSKIVNAVRNLRTPSVPGPAVLDVAAGPGSRRARRGCWARVLPCSTWLLGPGLAVLDADRRPTDRQYLHLHPSPAVPAVAGWLQLPGGPAGGVLPLAGRRTAPVAPGGTDPRRFADPRRVAGPRRAAEPCRRTKRGGTRRVAAHPGRAHSVSESALIGIFRSWSSSRSVVAGRPSVVR